MADKMIAVPESHLVSIADAIREKRDLAETIPVPDMAMQVGLIESGGGMLEKVFSGSFELQQAVDYSASEAQIVQFPNINLYEPGLKPNKLYVMNILYNGDVLDECFIDGTLVFFHTNESPEVTLSPQSVCAVRKKVTDSIAVVLTGLIARRTYATNGKLMISTRRINGSPYFNIGRYDWEILELN